MKDDFINDPSKYSCYSEYVKNWNVHVAMAEFPDPIDQSKINEMSRDQLVDLVNKLQDNISNIADNHMMIIDAWISEIKRREKRNKSYNRLRNAMLLKVIDDSFS